MSGEKKKAILPPILPEESELILADEVFLLNCQREEERILARQFTGAACEEEELSHMIFSGVRFKGCRFWNCSFRSSDFTDVVFENCDFSGCDFGDGHMERVSIHSCKGVGAKFTGMVLKNLLLSECNFDDGNFDASRLEQVQVERTRLRNGNLTGCICRQVSWREADLKNASFFKTSLRGMDFSDSEITGIVVSDDNRELSGVTVDLYQAAELAKKMGIIIKDV